MKRKEVKFFQFKFLIISLVLLAVFLLIKTSVIPEKECEYNFSPEICSNPSVDCLEPELAEEICLRNMDYILIKKGICGCVSFGFVLTYYAFNFILPFVIFYTLVFLVFKRRD